MLRWIKRIVAILAALGIIALIVMAMMPKPVPVETGTVTRGPLQVTVDEDGQTRVQNRYVITAPVAGHLERIELRAGDEVEVGALLARVTPTTSPLLDRRSRDQVEAQARAAGAAVSRAKAMAESVRLAREQAERDLKRTRSLADSGALSDHALEEAEVQTQSLEKQADAAELGVRVAQHELEMARAALRGADGSVDAKNQLVINAPIKGSVLRVHTESAGVIGPGTPLLEIGDLSSLEVVVDLLTSDAVNVEPGDKVHLERWGGNGQLVGRVRRVEPSAFTKISALGVEEQRVLVVIDPVEGKTWKGLGDGYRVEASIVVWNGNDVLKVPANATFRHQDGWALFAIEGGKAVTKPIEIGRRTGLEVEITSGIDETATVILHPSDEIEEGTLVEAK
jgi:HlyD family secretion protein